MNDYGPRGLVPSDRLVLMSSVWQILITQNQQIREIRYYSDCFGSSAGVLEGGTLSILLTVSNRRSMANGLRI